MSVADHTVCRLEITRLREQRDKAVRERDLALEEVYALMAKLEDSRKTA
jgi:hypothetical protein